MPTSGCVNLLVECDLIALKEQNTLQVFEVDPTG